MPARSSPASLMAACKLSDIRHYKEKLDTDKSELKELIEEVVVPETWFFRDTNPFKMLAKFVTEEWLPSEPEGPLRVLSLPCATGEEPYSIAITLIDAGLFPSQVRIDAFDISGRNIKRCKEARYRNNSFRGVDPFIRDRFFSKRDGAYSPDILIRAMVNFDTASLLDPGFINTRLPYDVVFCRNLLIYFDHETQMQAAQMLYKLLNPTGILFVGHAETGIFINQCHVSHRYPKAFALRKNLDITTHKRKPCRVKPGTRSQRKKTSTAKPRTTRFGTTRPGTINKPVTTQKPAPISPPKLERITARKNVKPTPTQGLEQAKQFADSGRYTDAEAICIQHLEQDKQNEQAYYLLALIQIATGGIQKAVEYLKNVIYLDPKHYDALMYLATLIAETGDGISAARYRERAQRIQKRLNVQRLEL